MIKNLVSFGCSWPHGTELEDPNDAYPALIAQHYDWAFEDHTRINTTLPEMLADFDAWVTTASKDDIAESLVLVGLTHETANNGISEDDVFEQVVAAFNNNALLKQVNLIQFNVMARQHKLKYRTLIESSSALEMLVIRDKPRKAPLFTEHKFPNERGHSILSEFLIKKIDSVTIHE